MDLGRSHVVIPGLAAEAAEVAEAAEAQKTMQLATRTASRTTIGRRLTATRCLCRTFSTNFDLQGVGGLSLLTASNSEQMQKAVQLHRVELDKAKAQYAEKTKALEASAAEMRKAE